MLKSAGFTFIAKLLTALLNFVIVIVISRYLGVSERGVCGWYLVIVGVSLAFAEIAGGSVSAYLLQKYPMQQLMVFSYCWSLLIAISIPGFFYVIGKINGQECLLLMPVCWLNAANSLHTNLLLGKQKLLQFNIISLLVSGCILTSIFTFFASGWLGSTMYLYALIVGTGVGTLVGFILCKRLVSGHCTIRFPMALVRDAFCYGVANQSGHLVAILNNRMIYFLMPATALGVFANALSLAEAMLLLPASMGQMLYTTVLSNKKQADEKANLLWWLCIVTMIAGTGVILIIPQGFYEYVFGAGFAAIKPYLVILAFGMIFYGGFQVLTYWHSANGRFQYNFYAFLVALVFNAIVGLLLFSQHRFTPFIGCCLVAASFFLLNLVSLWQFRQFSALKRRFFAWPSLHEWRQIF